jgi:hypothetical protein
VEKFGFQNSLTSQPNTKHEFVKICWLDTVYCGVRKVLVSGSLWCRIKSHLSMRRTSCSRRGNQTLTAPSHNRLWVGVSGSAAYRNSCHGSLRAWPLPDKYIWSRLMRVMTIKVSKFLLNCAVTRSWPENSYEGSPHYNSFIYVSCKITDNTKLLSCEWHWELNFNSCPLGRDFKFRVPLNLARGTWLEWKAEGKRPLGRQASMGG